MKQTEILLALIFEKFWIKHDLVKRADCYFYICQARKDGKARLDFSPTLSFALGTIIHNTGEFHSPRISFEEIGQLLGGN